MLQRFFAGDERALARALTLVERLEPQGAALLGEIRAKNTHQACVVGITGAPGAGKSSLVDRLIETARAGGERVAVVAVDPSSPFGGGAILGDRIRMSRHHQDRGVFVRSMASRGALGGLARASVAAVSVLEAFGFERVFIETVGVGQSEVDIARAADHTVLVMTPNAGDAVQAFKAGIMEIADVFAINKADLPGAERLERELQAALELGHAAAPHASDLAHDDTGHHADAASKPAPPQNAWWPPVVKTVAQTGAGAAGLLVAIDAHRTHLGDAGLAARRLERARFEIEAAISDEVRRLVRHAGAAALADVAAGTVGAEETAKALLRALG